MLLRSPFTVLHHASVRSRALRILNTKYSPFPPLYDGCSPPLSRQGNRTNNRELRVCTNSPETSLFANLFFPFFESMVSFGKKRETKEREREREEKEERWVKREENGGTLARRKRGKGNEIHVRKPLIFSRGLIFIVRT